MPKLLFEGEQKRSVFVSVPLNVNELLLLAQMAELLQLVSFYLTHTCIENIITFYTFMFNPESDNDGEKQ